MTYRPLQHWPSPSNASLRPVFKYSFHKLSERHEFIFAVGRFIMYEYLASKSIYRRLPLFNFKPTITKPDLRVSFLPIVTFPDTSKNHKSSLLDSTHQRKSHHLCHPQSHFRHMEQLPFVYPYRSHQQPPRPFLCQQVEKSFRQD